MCLSVTHALIVHTYKRHSILYNSIDSDNRHAFFFLDDSRYTVAMVSPIIIYSVTYHLSQDHLECSAGSGGYCERHQALQV